MIISVDMTNVQKGVALPWNPDTQNITISTDSVENSADLLVVLISAGLGTVEIYFDTKIKYKLGMCTPKKRFPVTLPTVTKKYWTIKYNYAEKNVVLYCNGIEVANVVLSDSVCTADPLWRQSWGIKHTNIWFDEGDTASDSYSLSRGKYNGGHWFLDIPKTNEPNVQINYTNLDKIDLVDEINVMNILVDFRELE